MLLDHPERPALHYRRWYELLTDAEYTAAGKDPLAVFLTQSRSLHSNWRVRHRPQAPRRLRERLAGLHAELGSLAFHTADLAAIRERRREITAETERTEHALAEAEALLAPVGDLQHAVGW